MLHRGRKGLGMPLLVAASSAFLLPGAGLLFNSAYLTVWAWSAALAGNLWCAVARAALSLLCCSGEERRACSERVCCKARHLSPSP